MKLRYISLALAFAFGLESCYTPTGEAQNQAEATMPDGGKFLLSSTPFTRDFVTHFKPLKLPLSIGTEIDIKDTIPAETVIKNILEPSIAAGSPAFGDFWGEAELNARTRKGLKDRRLDVNKNIYEVLNFGYVGRIDLHKDYYTLVFKAVPTFMDGTFAYTYLATYALDGKLVDAIQIGGSAGYTDMQSEWAAEITEQGQIVVHNKTIKRGGMEDGSTDLTETAQLTYNAQQGGKLRLVKQRYNGFSGNYQGKTVRDMVHIEIMPDDVRLSYQDAQTVRQELNILKFDKVAGVIDAKFNSGKKLKLRFNEDRTALEIAFAECNTQTFTRQNN